MPLPAPFDAVVFDLDGTLVATRDFWLPAARAGARRAFRELGLEREPPGADAWMSMVGLPLAEGFARVFPDLGGAQLELLMARCVEEEEAALRAGGARLMPGASEALDRLRADGVRMGVASNCTASYLETMLSDLGLSRWVSEARCLDSPGIATKADMVADLLSSFGTRSAVMVGDRAGDREAAHQNGLPHVHLTAGFAPRGEDVRAEATLADLADLPDRLAGRTRWIASALAAIDLAPDRVGGPRTVGVTGAPLAGTTLFARDAARLLRAGGRRVDVVDCERWRRAPGAGPESFDLPALRAEALDPFWRAGAGPEDRGAVRIVEGPVLLAPVVATGLDRIVHLAVSADAARRRLCGRDGVEEGSGGLQRWLETDWRPHRALSERWPPERVADLVLDAENPLGNVPAGSG